MLPTAYPATLVGVADVMRALSRTFASQPPQARQPAGPKSRPRRLETIGRSAFGAAEDISVFLQCWGPSLGQSRRLAKAAFARLKSLVYHLHQVGWQAIPIMALVTFYWRNHRPARHLSFPQVRRWSMSSIWLEFSSARNWRPDCRHHGRRPIRKRLHRRTRLDENARGNRRLSTMGLDPVEV